MNDRNYNTIIICTLYYTESGVIMKNVPTISKTDKIEFTYIDSIVDKNSENRMFSSYFV